MTSTTTVDVRALLKAGAHFGHRVSHWNPKMREYIYGERGGIYIIDLIKTAEQLTKALEFAEEIAAAGKQVLFVGTKKHTREGVKEAAIAAGMPYEIERWFGGTLTNYGTVSKRIKYLKDQEEKLESGKLAEGMSKRELGEAKEEMAKLNVSFGGLKNMDGLPGALFVADVVSDMIAVKEAKNLGIPVIGVVDTNGDPTDVDIVIPANDDALSTTKVVSDLIAGAITAGKKRVKAAKPEGEDKPKITAEMSSKTRTQFKAAPKAE